MIINIPLTIDDNALEQKIQEDVDKNVDNYMKELISEALRKNHNYYGRCSVTEAIVGLAEERISQFFEANKDEIIDATAKRIDERVRNRKKVKDAIKEVEQDG